MPKRSNLFQRIVHALYQSLKPVSGTVTESALVLESTSSLTREIDILAESVVYGVTVRVAVEVRGRTRKDDVAWIDILIGKYRDLKVDKIIAVSATGFSKAARVKADAANIHLLSARDAEAYDWPGEFQRIGAGMVTRKDHVDVSIRTEPAGRRDFDRDSRITNSDGNDLGSLGEFIEFVADRHRTRLTEMLRLKFFEYYKTLSDLDKVLLSEDLLKPQRTIWVRTTSGDRIPIVHAAVRARTTNEVAKAPVRHTAISTSLVSSVELNTSDGSGHELFAVQTPDKPGRIQLQVRPKQKTTSPKANSGVTRASSAGAPANQRVEPTARVRDRKQGGPGRRGSRAER